MQEIDSQCLETAGYLKKLTLQNNKIEVIPEEIIKLINLEVLDLSHNNISLYASYIYIFLELFYIFKLFVINGLLIYFYRVPFCIGILPNLKQFAIKGNNIKNIRADIIQCGTPRILTHIRQITDSTNINTRGLLQSSTNVSIYPDKYVNIN